MRTTIRTIVAGAGDWTKPYFDDPGVSTVVTMDYKPARDVDTSESWRIIWHGELTGPDPNERQPFLASPIEEDHQTLKAAQRTVEKAFKKRYGHRTGDE